MGILDIFRGKKKEEADQIAPAGDSERTFEPYSREDNLQPNFPSFQPGTPVEGFGQNISGRDIDLILSKLELINRKLDDIDRRVQFIEKVAKESQ